MDSRVVQSQVHDDGEHYPHNVASQQVTNGVEDPHFDHEKKSVLLLNKVKTKAKKIKDTIKKHGHQVLDRGRENNNEDQHTLGDHDLDDGEEMAEDPKVHETPIHENVVKTATPTSEQVENLGKSGINFGGTVVKGEEPHHEPLVEGDSSTTEIDGSLATDPAKAFSVEEKGGLPKDNLERPIDLKEEDPHGSGSRPEAYTPNDQIKVTDPSVAGSDEIEITPVEESFGRMNVQDEPKPAPESNIQSTVVDSEYPPAGSHDQFVSHFSDIAQTQYPSGESHDQFSSGSKPEAYTSLNHQTKVSDLSGAGGDEIEITPVEEYFARKNVHDEAKPAPEPIIQQTVADTEYPSAGSHDQFAPHFSDATQTQYPSAESHDQFSSGSRPEEYTSPNYQTKVSDASGAGSDEIEITPVEESFAKMNVHDDPKPGTEPIVQPTVADPEYPSAGSYDQFVPHLSAETQTQYPSAESYDQFSQETISPNINRNLENPTETFQTFNTIPNRVGEQPHYEANTDNVVSPKNAIASEVGSGEKGDISATKEEQQKDEVTSNKSGSSSSGYGKNIAQSVTKKLAPVYEKVAGVGSAVKSRVTGTGTGSVGTEIENGVKEQDKDKGASVKDYLAEKLRPGEEDKALSEVISEALHKGKEEPVKNKHAQLGSGDEKSENVSEESSVNSPGKGVVDKLKGVVGSWFGKSDSSKVAGGEDLSKNTNYGAEVVGENRSSPIEEQGTR